MRTAAILALALAFLVAGPAFADDAVTYHRFGHDVYGSDGSRSHEFGGDTYRTDRNGHETRCHEFAGRETCATK